MLGDSKLAAKNRSKVVNFFKAKSDRIKQRAHRQVFTCTLKKNRAACLQAH